MAAARIFTRVFSPRYFQIVNPRRSYSRGLRREPVKVLTNDEAQKLTGRPSLFYQEEQPPPNKSKEKSGSDDVKRVTDVGRSRSNRVASNEREDLDVTKSNDVPKEGRKKSKVLEPSDTELITVFSEDKELKLTIIKDRHAGERKLSSLMMVAKTPKARKSSGKILLEGERLIADAMKAGVPTEAIFFHSQHLLSSLPLARHPRAQLYQVNQSVIQLWSELTTSPGIAAFFDIRKVQELEFLKHTEQIPLTLICDNVRDPGNMGSILRSAAAVGCRRLICTPDCVDLWDSKVLRSAAGAHFRVKTVADISWDRMVGNYVHEDSVVLLATSGVNRNRPHAGDKNRLSKQELANQLIRAESRWTNSKTVDVSEDGLLVHRDPSYTDRDLLKLYSQLPLPITTYDDLKLESIPVNPSVVLVIGGETHGLSHAAFKLAHDLGGSQVTIPLENEVESLNVGVAFGVLAYEIRRQLLSHQQHQKSSHSSSGSTIM